MAYIGEEQTTEYAEPLELPAPLREDEPLEAPIEAPIEVPDVEEVPVEV